MADDTQTRPYIERLAALEQQRNYWLDLLKDIRDYIAPRRGMFVTEGEKPNQDVKRHAKIIDGVATRSLRTLVAGMQGGLTSPSRPWFRLAHPDPEMMEFEPVRVWLDDVQRLMFSVFAGSNFYRAMPNLYSDQGAFGTGCMLLEEDQQEVIRCRLASVGEYNLANSARGIVDTVYRRFWVTARQMVQEFGEGKVSSQVKDQMKNNPYTYFEIVHAVQPRKERDSSKKDATNMPWESVYFEFAQTNMLKKSGYNEMPFMCPRWDTESGEAYGRSPGHDVIGDVKMLQEMQKTGLKSLHKAADPPINAPENTIVNLLPGGINPYAGAGAEKVEPVYLVKPDLQGLEFKIERTQTAIREGFYNDLFLMLMERPGMTATEVVERQAEKLLMLGPTIDRQHNELLDPAINRTFAIMARRNMLPPPPEELQGEELEIEYISILAQAQKAVATRAIDETTQYVLSVADASPQVLDKFDFDEAVDQRAAMLGVPTKIIRADDVVADIRQKRAEAQQQREQLQMEMAQLQAEESEAKTAQGGAQAAKNLAEAEATTAETEREAV